MTGGVADALDYAAAAWIAPHVLRHNLTSEALWTLIQELPRTTALLRKALE